MTRNKDIMKVANSKSTQSILSKMSDKNIIDNIDGLFGNLLKIDKQILAVNTELLTRYFNKITDSIDNIQTITETFIKDDNIDLINMYIPTATFLDEFSDFEIIKEYIEQSPHKWIDCDYYRKLQVMNIVIEEVSDKTYNSLGENNSIENFLNWTSEIKYLFPSSERDTQFNFNNINNIMNQIFPFYRTLYKNINNVLSIIERPSYNWKEVLNKKLLKRSKDLSGDVVELIETAKPEIEALISDSYKRALGLTDTGIDWLKFVSGFTNITDEQKDNLYKKARRIMDDKKTHYKEVGQQVFGKALDDFLEDIDKKGEETVKTLEDTPQEHPIASSSSLPGKLENQAEILPEKKERRRRKNINTK